MLLSRFWNVLLTLALGGAAFTLYVASQMYNHAGAQAMNESLTSDSSAVDWYLRDDARRRAAAMIAVALSPQVVEGLGKATGDAKIDRDTRAKVKAALTKVAAEVPADFKFDALWAVDANGRVVANIGFDHTEEWDLGGYAAVADAIHGWIRDDAWVWKGRIYRVVTRPVEREAQGEPVGAIIGAKIVDDTFARAVTKRTGAAVGFYAEGARVASGAPEGFDKADLDEITSDLKALDADKDYQDPQKGRSDVRVLRGHLGVVYARLPGEAWDLGAGYAVGRSSVTVSTPGDFLTLATNTDKEKVPTKLIIAGVLVLIAFGLLLSFVEHNRPLNTFHQEALRLSRGEIDVFSPSRFRGVYKKIAADLNDGMEKVAAKGGAPRRAVDLEQVLGPIPAQPSMSAFSVPGGQASPAPAVEPPSRGTPRGPSPERSAPRLRQSGQSGQMPAVTTPTEAEVSEAFDVRGSAPTPDTAASPRAQPPVKRVTPAVGTSGVSSSSVISLPDVGAMPNAQALAAGDDYDEVADWRRVFEDFLALKKQCGEDTSSLTFEKFKGTLQRNKEALVTRHSCNRVKFTVYVKEGKAALKASPVK